MSMNAYKFGFSGLENTIHSPYEVTDHHMPRMDDSRSTWDYPESETLNSEEPTTLDMQPGGDAVVGVHAIPEEC